MDLEPVEQARRLLESGSRLGAERFLEHEAAVEALQTPPFMLPRLAPLGVDFVSEALLLGAFVGAAALARARDVATLELLLAQRPFDAAELDDALMAASKSLWGAEACAAVVRALIDRGACLPPSRYATVSAAGGAELVRAALDPEWMRRYGRRWTPPTGYEAKKLPPALFPRLAALGTRLEPKELASLATSHEHFSAALRHLVPPGADFAPLLDALKNGRHLPRAFLVDALLPYVPLEELTWMPEAACRLVETPGVTREQLRAAMLALISSAAKHAIYSQWQRALEHIAAAGLVPLAEDRTLAARSLGVGALRKFLLAFRIPDPSYTAGSTLVPTVANAREMLEQQPTEALLPVRHELTVKLYDRDITRRCGSQFVALWGGTLLGAQLGALRYCKQQTALRLLEDSVATPAHVAQLLCVERGCGSPRVEFAARVVHAAGKGAADAPEVTAALARATVGAPCVQLVLRERAQPVPVDVLLDAIQRCNRDALSKLVPFVDAPELRARANEVLCAALEQLRGAGGVVAQVVGRVDATLRADVAAGCARLASGAVRKLAPGEVMTTAQLDACAQALPRSALLAWVRDTGASSALITAWVLDGDVTADLERGLDLTLRDAEGRLALEVAVARRRMRAVERLLQLGSPPLDALAVARLLRARRDEGLRLVAMRGPAGVDLRRLTSAALAWRLTGGALYGSPAEKQLRAYKAAAVSQLCGGRLPGRPAHAVLGWLGV